MVQWNCIISPSLCPHKRAASRFAGFWWCSKGHSPQSQSLTALPQTWAAGQTRLKHHLWVEFKSICVWTIACLYLSKVFMHCLQNLCFIVFKQCHHGLQLSQTKLDWTGHTWAESTPHPLQHLFLALHSENTCVGNGVSEEAKISVCTQYSEREAF